MFAYRKKRIVNIIKKIIATLILVCILSMDISPTIGKIHVLALSEENITNDIENTVEDYNIIPVDNNDLASENIFYKAPIYANIRNTYPEDYKYDNSFEYLVTTQVEKENGSMQTSKLCFEDDLTDFTSQVQIERTKEPESTEVKIKYEDLKYYFNVSGSESYFEQNISQSVIKNYINSLKKENGEDLEIYRILINKEIFEIIFGENGYIKFKSEGNDLGEININSSTNSIGELYIDLSSKLQNFTIETNNIEDGTEFFLKFCERGEIENTIITQNEKYPSKNDGILNVKYKQIKINKELFDRMFGENGYIDIYEINEQIVNEDETEDNNENIERSYRHSYTINKNTQVDENNNYIINFDEDIDKIKIETSEPIEEGKLEIKYIREFSQHMNYSAEAIHAFQNLYYKISISKLKKDNNVERLSPFEYKLKLIDTCTDVGFKLDKNKISSMGEKQDIKFTIELNNNSFKSDLYKNPVFIIELPEETEEIELKKVDILFCEEVFKDELKIKNAEIIRFNNHYAIRIDLEGRENKYLTENLVTGTNIIVSTSIKSSQLISKEESIGLYYFNEYAIDYKNTVELLNLDLNTIKFGYTSENIEFISLNGIFAINEIQNFDGEGNNICSKYDDSSIIEGKLNIYSKEIMAKQNQMIVNNSGYTCKNIVALGKTIHINNENMKTGDKFETNIDTIVKSPININKKGATIYYSENPNATLDFNTQNNWQTEIEDFTKIKAYLIIIDELKDKEIVQFNYDIYIPGQLEYCVDMYTNFLVKYVPETEISNNVELKITSNTLKLTTGIGPRMQVSTYVSAGDGNEISERDRLKYTIKVENTGSLEITNLKIKDIIPKGTIYTEYSDSTGDFDQEQYIKRGDVEEISWDIGSLPVGETITRQFEVVVRELPTIEEYYGEDPNFTKINDEYYLLEFDKNTGEEITRTLIEKTPDVYVENYATVTADAFGVDINSNITRNKVNMQCFEIEEVSSYSKDTVISENQEYNYNIIIQNKSFENFQNVEVTKVLPEGIEFLDAYQLNNDEYIKNAVFNEETNQIVWNIDRINRNDVIQLEVKVKAKELPEDVYEKKIETKTIVIDTEGRLYSSNEVENIIAKPKMNVEITSIPNTQYVKENETITYHVKIENIGKILISPIKINAIIPDELVCIGVNYQKGNLNVDSMPNSNGDVEISIGLDSGETLELNIIVDTGTQDKTKNEIDVTTIVSVEAPEVEKIDQRINHIIEVTKQSDMPVGENMYKIKGTAWYDENKNGRREKNERIFSNLQAYLMNESGNIIKQTKTDLIGEYCFEELEEGNYYVIFLYDIDIYELAEYKGKDIEDEYNSDVVQTDIIIDNKLTKGAVTNTINLRTRSALNIDIGLAKKPEFDLSLSKSIVEISLKTYSSEKQYSYQNSEFVKLDIKAKEIKNADVLINYEFKITNEGELEGQVCKIADYIPKGLEFISDLNPTWYLSSDGTYYNTELLGQEIKPGESKTINLLLTKKNVGTNTQTYENTAEIIEYFNEKGIADKDSIPSNKQEDDYSKATLMITIATGGNILYIGLCLVALIILATILLLLKFKPKLIEKIKKIKKFRRKGIIK